MKNFPQLFVLPFLLFLCLNAHAQGFTVLPDPGEAGGFDITAQLDKIPVEWNLNAQENGDAYRLRIEPTRALLSTIEDGKNTPLAANASSIAAGPLLIQRRGPSWVVLVNNRVVLQAEDDRWMEGDVSFRGGSVKDARLQPVEEITFDDDFMRVASDVAITKEVLANPRSGVQVTEAKIEEEAIWTVLTGAWGTTGISEQEQAQVAQSANPFAFSSKNKGENLAVAGRQFWNDYSVEAAVKPHTAQAIGLAIYVQDAKNYLLFEWRQNGLLQIRGVVDGVSQVLAAGQTEGYDEKNWYRLKFAARGGILRALIDENEVLRARTDLFGRGLVGLFTENAEEDATAAKERTAVFDDLHVRSVVDFYDNFAVPVEGRWQTITGAWKFENAASPADSQGAFAVMGQADWDEYTASAEVQLPADAAAGLVAHHLKGEGAYIFRIAGSQAKLPYAGKAQILQIGEGKSTPIAEVNVGNRFDNTRGRWNFSIERGYLQGTVEIDEKVTRVLDAWNDSTSAGRAGLYAHRGAKGVPVLRNFAVEFPRQKSVWAAVPEIYVDDRQAETMGAWSTPEGSWLPISPIKNTTPLPPEATAKDAKVFWHKGAFWGDQDIRFKLPALKTGENLTLVLGRVTPNQTESTPPLVLVLKTEKENLQATLSRGASEKLKDGSQKIEGELEGQPIEISRRGNYMIVRVGDEYTQSTLLAAKISD